MDPDQAQRARRVTDASPSLGAFLDDDPVALARLAEPLPDDFGPALSEALEVGGPAGLRIEKRRRLCQIAGYDLGGEIDLERATAALADLAGSTLDAALGVVEAPTDLAVIGMGKLGGRELNYVSDIDILFVTTGDNVAATKAAEGLLQAIGRPTPEGHPYEIDANLRPEGRSGALVRSLDSYLEYYERWAEPWEFQALLKARPVAGSRDVGSRFVEATRAYVFPAEVDRTRVEAIRKMKRRVEDHAAKAALRKRVKDADDVKLGPGGIRDIEFSVQLLQLVHGGADESLRSPTTLASLSALVNGGYVAEEDGAGLAVAYRWLRVVEHRLQLRRERRVRTLPKDADKRTDIARSLGFKDSPAASAVEGFDERHGAVLADVRGRFEKLFYRPMVEALADPGGGMSRDALGERLRVLGFRDVQRAAQTLEGLVGGTSRRSKILRVLTPAMLRFLASAPLPDEGLFSFMRVAEATSAHPEALGALRDNPPGLEFLARTLGTGPVLGEILAHVPEELHTIADPHRVSSAKDRDQLIKEAIASLEWRDPEHRLDGLRRFKRREMLRVALEDLVGTGDVDQVGRRLADLADACLTAALVGTETRFAVVGMGKLGGRELNYSSDIDVMFLHDSDPAGADKIATELVRAIGEVTPEGQAFRIDADLRPEGRNGPLVRSLASYLEYYERWARPWEHQALLKARWAAGDRALAEELIAATRIYSWPQKLSDEARAEIRHLKARMEKERVPRGVDPRRHLKMGPGGLSDVEFAVQLLQLEHAATHESLRAPGTVEVLEAAGSIGLIDGPSVARLVDGYRFLTRLRDRMFFMSGRPSDALPDKPESLESLGIAMGFEDQPRQELEEAYLRATRRVRKVAAPLIFG